MLGMTVCGEHLFLCHANPDVQGVSARNDIAAPVGQLGGHTPGEGGAPKTGFARLSFSDGADIIERLGSGRENMAAETETPEAPAGAWTRYANGYFAQRIVQPLRLPGIMRRHIYTGAMSNVWANLIAGLFMVYYGNRIGMTSFQWGVMSCLASWVLVGQVLTGALVRRAGQRKLVWFLSAAADRSLRMIGILASLWLWKTGNGHAAFVLIAGVVAANLFGAMVTPAWLSWMADLIPEREQGAFWGRRSAWIAFCVAATIVPAGYLFDRTPETLKMNLALGVFIVATGFGLLDLVIHGTIPEPALPRVAAEPYLAQLMRPLRDRRFRAWLQFNMVWTASVMVGATLTLIYALENLGLKKNLLGGTVAITVVSLCASIVTASWSGRLVDRVGPKRVMAWGYLFWAFIPLTWMLATPGTALFWYGIASIIGGVACTAGATATNKLLTRLPPPEHRATYIAVGNSATHVAAGLGALAAGTVAWWLDRDWTGGMRLGEWSLNTYRLLFLISMCMRLGTFALLLPRVRDPRPSPAAPAAEGGG